MTDQDKERLMRIASKYFKNKPIEFVLEVLEKNVGIEAHEIPSMSDYKLAENLESAKIIQSEVVDIDFPMPVEEPEEGPFGGAFSSWEDYYKYRGAL